MRTLINFLACFLLGSIILMASAGVKVESHHYDFGTCKHLIVGGAMWYSWFE